MFCRILSFEARPSTSGGRARPNNDLEHNVSKICACAVFSNAQPSEVSQCGFLSPIGPNVPWGPKYSKLFKCFFGFSWFECILFFCWGVLIIPKWLIKVPVHIAILFGSFLEPNMGPRTPYLLQKYFKEYENKYVNTF